MANSMTGGYGPTGKNPYSLRQPLDPSKGLRGDILPKHTRVAQLQQFDPSQMRLYKSLFGQLGPDSYLSRLAGGDESIFQDIEAPQMQQFASQMGNLGNRFSGMGLGGMKSSGFQLAGSSAASNFAQQLAAQRQALQMKGLEDLMRFSQMLLGERPTERSLYSKQQKEKTPWGSVAGSALGAGVGGYFGGPQGAAVGANVGGQVGGAAFD